MKKHHIEPIEIPSSMSIRDLTSMTSKERILLYLSDYHNMEERYEFPADLVQQSIAFATGIQRKHLSQYLDDLIRENLIAERKAHIQGMRQRMNGYYLSPSGYARASALRERIAELVVPISIGGKVVQMKLIEIDEATSAHVTFCDIVREAIQHNGLDMANLESVEARKRQALEEKEQATEVYRRALRTAWRDGRVTATERFLIEELRKHLEITDEQHRRLEEEIIKKLAQDHMEFRRIYRMVLEVALADRAIAGPEEEILEALRRVMRISHKEHEGLVKEVELAICGPPGCEKELQRDIMSSVR